MSELLLGVDVGTYSSKGVLVDPAGNVLKMTKLGMSNPEWAKTWLEMTSTGQLGEPIKVAHAVLHLASGAASFSRELSY